MGDMDMMRWGEDKLIRLGQDKIILSWLGPSKPPG
jgi:hypothetical protein